jgi:hypothetical protein
VPEEVLRWSEEGTARMQFGLAASGPLVLRMRMQPGPAWVGAGGLPLTLELDGRALAEWTLLDGLSVYSVPLKNVGGENVLELKMPDMPAGVRRGDPRPLRAGIEWLRVDPFAPLRPGVPVPIGEEGAEAYLGAGWGHAEGEYRWTVAPRAVLHVAPEGLSAGVLRMRMHPYPASARGTGQRVFVSVNGELAGTLALRGTDAVVHAVPLPAGLGGADTIVLEMPDAAPFRGRGSDPRQLGVAVYWLKLDPFPLLSPGNRVNLAGPDSDGYLGDGWGVPEEGTRATVDLTADVLFAAEPSTSSRLALVMEPVLTRLVASQRVRLVLNGQSLGTLTLTERVRRTYDVPVPRGSLLRQNVLRLAFPDARSAASLGLRGGAHHLLSVRVRSVELRP